MKPMVEMAAADAVDFEAVFPVLVFRMVLRIVWEFEAGRGAQSRA